MKFLITLSVDTILFGNILPVSYQYELSSFIYRTLIRSGSGYCEWLCANGFATGCKQFRPFSFSNLLFPDFKIENDRLFINSQQCGFIVSFLPEKMTEAFVNRLLAGQKFSIGDQLSKVAFEVTKIELLTDLEFAVNTEFVTLTPVCITRKETNTHRMVYEPPETDFAKKALLANLKNKYNLFYGREYKGNTEFELKVKDKPRSKLIAIKSNTAQQMRVKGFNFSFSVQADPELLRIMYKAGLGEKNAMGFGHVETKENLKRIREKLKR